MPEPDQATRDETKLPKSLVDRLVLFRASLRRRKAWEIGAAGFCICLVSFVIFTALDRIIDSSSGIRLLFFSLGLTSLLAAAPFWFYKWVSPFSQPAQIANLIAKHYPRLGDRLLGIIELQSHHLDNEAESANLRRAAIEVVAKEIASRNLEAALPKSSIKGWILSNAVAIACIAAIALQSTKTLHNAFQRWSMPLAQISRYTSTQIEADDIKEIQYCPVNEPFQLSFGLSKRSAAPTTARAKMNGGRWIEVAIENREFTVPFPAILETAQIELHAGDAQYKFEVHPYTRPKVVNALATVSYPEYLGREADKVTLQAGNLKSLIGSSLDIQLNANRKLKFASAEIIASNGDSNESSDLALNISEDLINLNTINLDQAELQIIINITDTFGLSSTLPFKLNLDARKDLAPTAELKLNKPPRYILSSDSLSIDLSFIDDYGLKASGIAWTGSVDDSQVHRPANGRLELPNIDGKQESEDKQINLSLAELNIRPQLLQLRAWAKDVYPDREMIFSTPIEIQVLSEAQHREIIDQMSEDIIISLEEALQNELSIYDNTRRLLKCDESQFIKKSQRLLHYSLRDNEANNQSLANELLHEFDLLLKEVNRNPSLKLQTRTALAKATQNTNVLVSQLMPPVLNEISFSLQQAHQFSESTIHLNNAIERQNHSIRKLEETIELMYLAKKELQISSFINRFKEAAEDQSMISSSMIEAMLRTQEDDSPLIGSEFEPLDPSQQRDIVNLYALHQDVSQRIRGLIKDLTNYANRTNNQAYLDLVSTIQNVDVEELLESLSYELENNHSVLSSLRANANAELFSKWAQQLSTEQGAMNGSQGAGENANSDMNDEDVEFMLRIMAVVKEQQQIREKNRSLHQFKPDK